MERESDNKSGATTIERSAFLKGAAATVAAVAATGLGASAARASATREGPHVNLGASLSGDVYLWDAQPLSTRRLRSPPSTRCTPT